MGFYEIPIYVKKITSLNPTKYKFIKLDTAQGNYEGYIYGCIHSKFIDVKKKSPKTFVEWLETEI